MDSPGFRKRLCHLGPFPVGPLNGHFRLFFQLFALFAVQQQVGNQRAFLDFYGISFDLSSGSASPSVHRLILVVGVADGKDSVAFWKPEYRVGSLSHVFLLFSSRLCLETGFGGCIRLSESSLSKGQHTCSV